jgi:hypothetical protein
MAKTLESLSKQNTAVRQKPPPTSISATLIKLQNQEVTHPLKKVFEALVFSNNTQ